ncbi:MAG TPA: hypothetical protein DIS98_05815, partial [Colwellia sp.]|nr:hypothetical protein [Colwellia sp.]
SLTLSTEVLYYIWASKWVGDFIGIIFLTPVILFIGQNIYIKKSKNKTAAILATLCVLGVISLTYILSSHYKYMEKEQQFIKAIEPFVADMACFKQVKRLDGQSSKTLLRQLVN